MTAVPAPAKKTRGKGKAAIILDPLSQFVPGTKAEQLQALYNSWYGCKRCGLADFRMQPSGDPNDDIVFGDGNPDAAVMFIGEAPGEEEEGTGLPFIGSSGKLLNRMLANTSDNENIRKAYDWFRKGRLTVEKEKEFHEYVFNWRREEFFFTNTVACRPPENRQPTGMEAKACWERLWSLIYTVDPMVIVAVGKVALSTLLRKQSEITKIRGQLFDVEFDGRVGKLKYPVLPMLHPSYLLRKADWDTKGGDFDKTLDDLLKALRIGDTLRNKNFGTPIPKRMRMDQ